MLSVMMRMYIWMVVVVDVTSCVAGGHAMQGGEKMGGERGKRNGQLRLFKANGTESPGTSAQKNGNGRLLAAGSIRLRDLTFIHRLAIQDFPEDVISGVLRIQIGMRRHPNSDRPKSGHGPVPGADLSRIIPVARRVTSMKFTVTVDRTCRIQSPEAFRVDHHAAARQALSTPKLYSRIW